MLQVEDRVANRLPQAIQALQRYCRQPGISSQGVGIPETIDLIGQMVIEAGGQVRVLNDLGGNPVIYAEFEPGPEGSADKTLLFYNHYDVQPPEPLEEWNYPPFGAEIHEGKLFARGASDNKADLVARLQAISILQEEGLPCRIKFLIEGEEEIGSPSLPLYLEKYASLFQADACVWEWAQKNAEEKLEMVAGAKGLCYLELTSETADIDIHSAYAPVADNAAWRLTQALATLKTADHRIVVEGFYDEVEHPSESLKDIARNNPYDTAAASSLYGLKGKMIAADAARAALLFEPTMSICGIESGYTGVGVKTVIPRRAKAKLDCRLVPRQDPEDIARKIRRHLDKMGFADIHVELLSASHPFRSDMNHPVIGIVNATAAAVYGEGRYALMPNYPGTGPMHLFARYLGQQLPIVAIGSGWWDDRIHAPNESIRIKDFEEALGYMVRFIREFPRMDQRAES
ncbi:M20/M25/M40 family metallo-hydrolase [Cohnella terricola]|uniref:M20/M25/M40 family metallo-hydrolase n=1 Tax=Cohnella terricola TaxID=1289167 RepID=A0A559JWG5_9BACL|nr:M20/M25/M40 family metallo-hydrolase [Cohnella terricola]TVY04233.1 M20/M25/M40 family metallo-hydrolase [Cohnella terricola]